MATSKIQRLTINVQNVTFLCFVPFLAILLFCQSYMWLATLLLYAWKST